MQQELSQNIFTQTFEKLRYGVNRARTLSPLTSRSILLLSFTLFLYLGPMQEHDIIANIFVLAFTSIFIGLGATVTLQHLILRRKMKISIENTQSFSISGHKHPVVLSLKHASIFPLLELRISALFSDEHLKSPEFLVRGLSMKQRRVETHVTFPHRGEWKITKVSYILRDQLGLFKREGTLQHAIPPLFVLHPPVHTLATLPVFSSIQKEGDEYQALDAPLGDPLELKQYHPSDGLKKIVWKIYAKSGELVSRHPETSMNPEGSVAVLCLAGRHDSAARLALAYLEQSEQDELLPLFSCLGGTRLAKSAASAKKLLIESVWNTEYTPEIAEAALHLLTPKECSKELSNILIFFSEKETFNEQYVYLIEHVGKIIKNKNIEPIFFMAQKEKGSPSKLFLEQAIANRWHIIEETPHA